VDWYRRVVLSSVPQHARVVQFIQEAEKMGRRYRNDALLGSSIYGRPSEKVTQRDRGAGEADLGECFRGR
jgi:hypothetical protein